jgi:hypothetical protein
MCSGGDTRALPRVGFPIRKSAGQRSFSTSPRLIAAVHVLPRLLAPRHPPRALRILMIVRAHHCRYAVFKVRPRPRLPPRPDPRSCARASSVRANAAGPRGSPRRPGRARTSARALARSLKAEQHGSAAPFAHDEPLMRACAGALELRMHQVESTLDQGRYTRPSPVGGARRATVWWTRSPWRHPEGRRVPRKEVIQPQLPLRLPCYDFTPIADPTFDGCLPCGLAHRLRALPTFVV